ncbi:MAG: archaellin/type IV pilin N-terminal domain-containing protein [Nitrososphaerota archaeon]
MKNTSIQKNRMRNRGLTGLETAIILIAFVVVAAAFAFAVLNLGFTTTQKSSEVIRAGLSEATSAIELSGGVIARSQESGGSRYVSNITIYIKTGPGKEPIDMSDATLTVSYMDPHIHIARLTNGTNLIVSEVRGDHDILLEYGETWQITIKLDTLYGDLTNVKIGANEEFVVEIKPAVGAMLTVERILPPSIDPLMNLG